MPTRCRSASNRSISRPWRRRSKAIRASGCATSSDDRSNSISASLGAPATGLCLVFPTLSFRAADTLGNESVLSYEIAVDNQPPVLDLDPPPDLRIVRFDTHTRRTVCSWAFDPLGERSEPTSSSAPSPAAASIRSPCGFGSTMLTTRVIASASATDVPPNFMTTLFTESPRDASARR